MAAELEAEGVTDHYIRMAAQVWSNADPTFEEIGEIGSWFQGMNTQEACNWVWSGEVLTKPGVVDEERKVWRSLFRGVRFPILL